MRLLIQRVSEASVTIDEQVVGTIQHGLLVFVGIAPQDGPKEIEWLVNKLLSLKLFPDEAGRMKRSVQEVNGEILVVSQFTLYADVKKGTVPSWSNAAPPVQAEPIYDQFVTFLEKTAEVSIQTGRFGADMKVQLCNDGPLTLLIDAPTFA